MNYVEMWLKLPHLFCMLVGNLRKHEQNHHFWWCGTLYDCLKIPLINVVGCSKFVELLPTQTSHPKLCCNWGGHVLEKSRIPYGCSWYIVWWCGNMPTKLVWQKDDFCVLGASTYVVVSKWFTSCWQHPKQATKMHNNTSIRHFVCYIMSWEIWLDEPT